VALVVRRQAPDVVARQRRQWGRLVGPAVTAVIVWLDRGDALDDLGINV
jgi:hypothetical protein